MRRRQFFTVAGALALRAQTTPLNVVLIYADDLGYGDLGCYGSTLRTPAIDSLARDGVRFTNFYSANPVCSPSRAALLTGRYPTRVNVPRVLFPQDSEGLPASETTIAAMLKPLGYRTMCVGKWHLGHKPEYLPTKRGFDGYFGIPYSNDMKPAVLLRNEDTVEPEATQSTLTQRYTQEAVRFIEGTKQGPFFLYMPHTMPHIPLYASERFRGKSPQGIYGDVLEELDWSVGEVLGALKRKGLEKDTLVLFSSDNGPWFQGSPGRLRGRKGSTLEGGVRVPLLARLPGRIPNGRVVDGIGSTMDLLPTIAGLTGAQPPAQPLDGMNIWPMLAGKASSLEREALLYFDGWNLQCARWGKWKLHVARHSSAVYSPVPQAGRQNLPLRPNELYNLELDPEESYDVADRHPEVVTQILGRIEGLLPSFPDPVQNAWRETQARQTESTPAGQWPRAKN
ncbi:MAG TPA: sulfatase [Bryobacteraceae bacterium]|nr:sulfatase [Bryobacteraceae bacterium]